MSAINEQSNERYVALNGSDTNPGTIEAPWRTIGAAVNKLEPGHTLYIREGKYHEKFEIAVSGTFMQPITIRNYENERVVISGEGVEESDNIITMKGISNITLQGLEVCDLVTTGHTTLMGISYESSVENGSGSNITLIGNKVYNIRSEGNAHGIAFYGRNGLAPIKNVILDGNVVFNCRLGSSESVVLNGNIEGFEVMNNVVYDNNNIGIDLIGFEKVARDAEGNQVKETDYVRHGVVHHNKVYNISSNDNDAYLDEQRSKEGEKRYVLCAGAIYVDGGSHIVIENNYIENSDIGIEVATEHLDGETHDVIVRNNVIADCQGLTGIAFGGYDELRGYTRNCQIINNSLYGNRSAFLVQKSEGNLVENNVITGGRVAVEWSGDYSKTNTFGTNHWFIENDRAYNSLQRLSKYMQDKQIFLGPKV